MPAERSYCCRGRLQRLTRLVIGATLWLSASLASAQTPVKFSLDWRLEGPAAPFLMALEKGHFKAEGLDVTIDAGNGSREVIPRLASGAHDIGFADINTLIRFRDDNPTSDLKAVMMIYDKPPFAIIGRRSRGITKDIQSLAGKKFGAPVADGAYAQWPVFRALNALNESGMSFENIGFAVREPMLAAGEVDAVFAYATTTSVGLKARGVPADDITVLLMADYGLALYGNAILVSPRFLAESPDAVQGFLRALVRGIRDTIDDPAAAVALVVKRNEVVRPEQELERLKLALEQNIVTDAVRANGIGGINRARWETALDQLSRAAPLKDRARAAASFTDAFLPPASERRLVSP